MSKRLVKRFEDMSVMGSLELLQQTDGDIIVVVTQPSLISGSPISLQVEFCTHNGGGESPNVLQALYNLMDAVEKDNQEREQNREAVRGNS